MIKQMQQIEDLRKSLSIVNFGESLTDSDKSIIKTYEQKIEELLTEIKGKKGYIVELNRDGYTRYLTSDPLLCIGFAPTYFESVDEAKYHIDKAKLEQGYFDVKIKEVTIGEENVY